MVALLDQFNRIQEAVCKCTASLKEEFMSKLENLVAEVEKEFLRLQQIKNIPNEFSSFKNNVTVYQKNSKHYLNSFIIKKLLRIIERIQPKAQHKLLSEYDFEYAHNLLNHSQFKVYGLKEDSSISDFVTAFNSEVGKLKKEINIKDSSYAKLLASMIFLYKQTFRPL